MGRSATWILGLLAVVAVIVAVGIMAIILATGNATSVAELDPGDCWSISVDGSDRLETVDLVDCDAPHTAEVVFVGHLNLDRDRPYPGGTDLTEEVDRRCRSFDVDSIDRLDDFGLLPVAPDESSWEMFQGRFVCVAIPFGGEPVQGSLMAP
jgi:hypothetical protein